MFRENENRFDRPSSTLITAVMTAEGYRLNLGPQAKTVNKNYFLAHLRNRLHLDAVNWLMEQVGVRVLKNLNEALLEQIPAQLRHWISTINFFQQVVIMTKRNIPIQTMPFLIDHQAKYGAPIGKLYRNAKGITNMIYEIGIVQHRLLLTELLKRDVPVTLILDGTTLESTGDHYVVVYFQTIIKNIPTLMYYRLIPLGADLTGEGHWNAINKFLEAESFPIKEYLRRNLIAVVSDGAPSMTSTFMHHVKKFTNNQNLINIWCLAHKMNLGLKHAQEGRLLFQTVIETVNKLHSYFTTSPKRGAALKARGRAEGLTVRQIPRIIKVRWVSTQFEGLSVLMEMYEVIVKELTHLVGTLRGKDLAAPTEYLATMKTTNFVSSLAFLIDVTGYLTSINNSLQKQGTLIISNIAKRNALLFIGRHLYNTNGATLSVVLQEAICPHFLLNPQNNPGCTLEAFENGPVQFRGIQLVTRATEKLRDLRKPFLDEYVQQINYYFPVGLYDNYFIFSPKLLKLSQTGVPRATNDGQLRQQQIQTGFLDPTGVKKFGINAIHYLAYQTGWFKQSEGAPLITEWNQLARDIISSPEFADLSNTDAEKFWTNALQNFLYRWTPLTERLVRCVLALGATSVEAERAFSDLAWITGKRRTRLDWMILDHYLRIRYNIGEDMSKWNTIYYIVSWLTNGHCLVDDASCETRGTEEGDKDDRHVQKVFLEEAVDGDILKQFFERNN